MYLFDFDRRTFFTLTKNVKTKCPETYLFYLPIIYLSTYTYTCMCVIHKYLSIYNFFSVSLILFQPLKLTKICSWNKFESYKTQNRSGFHRSEVQSTFYQNCFWVDCRTEIRFNACILKDCIIRIQELIRVFHHGLLNG